MTTQLERVYQYGGDKPKKLLDSWDVATILGIGRSTVRQLVKEGRLACVQVTKRTRRFTREMVEEFIKSETVRRTRSWDVDFLEAARIVR
ncbi:MAG: helix-turn-helix domain-containing protein [Desulfomonile tiedjei]|uniref:Helix-turn-helix domain-containing protein n=1 Tax=Desulfomonile tiedjei TaxID=2358 RepID=A0A9D6V1W4_9BACT|nr:helix-turn-helix domain-containing protein [Desulfomonile tiedjei]